MMTVTEKAAYLKGLAEGLNLDESKPETKLIKAMLDVIDEMALSIADLEDDVDMIVDQLDAVDEDLSEVEDFVFGEDDLEDEYSSCEGCPGCGEGDYFEVECPACGEVICLDESMLDEESIECPACGETLEFDFDVDEDAEEDDE
ncbi:MAG: hypothetical protein MJ120_00630 [Clostridia bacterium]|nr:hypothetical protein [Clostridia bacterium]